MANKSVKSGEKPVNMGVEVRACGRRWDSLAKCRLFAKLQETRFEEGRAGRY